MNKRILLVAVFFCLLPALACGRQPQPTPSPTATAAPTLTPTLTPSPAPTATPSRTPTPGPLDANQAAERFAPSLALVETPLETGTAVLLADGYLLTNANTVWPFAAVRLLFADGSEASDVPVAHWDMMANLALLGPIETTRPPLSLGDGEDLAANSDVFLVAYEAGRPQATPGRLFETHQWARPELTFFQTNAVISAGQRGGILLDEAGTVIGLAGYFQEEVGYGLVLSAADIGPRLTALLNNHELNDLAGRGIPTGDLQRNSLTVILDDSFDQATYLFNQPAGSEIALETVEETNDVGFRVLDGRGDLLLAEDEPETGDESGAAETEIEGLHVVEVYQADDGRGTFHLDSSLELTEFEDEDDRRPVSVGRTYSGNLDYPGDVDTFTLFLTGRETFHIQVESAVIDPHLTVDFAFSHEDEIFSDDNSSGGLFGLDPQLTYASPDGGFLYIMVRSGRPSQIGGYFLTLDSPGSAAPPPVGPPPEPTPIVTDFGDMALYGSADYPFAMQYPDAFIDITDGRLFDNASCGPDADACFVGFAFSTYLIVLEEDLADFGLGGITLEEYVDLLIPALEADSATELVSRQLLRTDQGLEAEVLHITFASTEYEVVRFIYIHDDVNFNMIYLVPSDAYEDFAAVIDYTLHTFTVTDR